MQRLIAIINKIVHGCLYFFTLILILATGVQIFLRVLLNLPLSWTEEVARYAFIWWVFFGAMIALREGRHLGIDALMNLFPKKVSRWWQMGIGVCILAYLAVMLFQGLKLVRIQMIHSTPITGIPLGYVIAIIPICAVFMGLYTVDMMCKKWRARE
jgi:TRAP-type transport system small permease protein